MNDFNEQQIVNSWEKNAEPWVTAVRNGEIKSRALVTNKAILDAVIEQSPATVLDVGCGEGWLVRELNEYGVSALGIDIVHELIASAIKEGGGRFKQMSYEELSYDAIKEKFDVVVCNFSLLGNESVDKIFEQILSLLSSTGSFVVQTLHPVIACGDEEYIDGWREGSWSGFNKKFNNPAPWYFRTMETWKAMFVDHGFTLDKILEPLNDKADAPVSVIFVGTRSS